jgi:hypothetical protein
MIYQVYNKFDIAISMDWSILIYATKRVVLTILLALSPSKLIVIGVGEEEEVLGESMLRKRK